jgi:hypothetical protein
MSKQKKLYEMTYGVIEPEISLVKDPISPEEVPEDADNYDIYDDAIEMAQQMAAQFGGDIDRYAQTNYPEVLDMYNDDMTSGEKLIQYIVDGGLE